MRNDWYCVALMAGIIFLLFSIQSTGEKTVFIKKGSRIKATVIRIEEGKDNEGDAAYTPIFAFIAPDSTRILFKDATSLHRDEWRVGQETTAVYNPSDPWDAKLLNSFARFGDAIVMMCLAMPLLVLGGGYYITRLLIGARNEYFM